MPKKVKNNYLGPGIGPPAISSLRSATTGCGGCGLDDSPLIAR